MKKSQSTNRVLAVVSAVSVVLVVAVVALAFESGQLNQRLDKAEETTALARAEAESQNSLLRPAVAPKEKLVVFPELNIALPYNEITKTLQYSSEIGLPDSTDGNLRITSTMLIDHEIRQMGCSELVRVSTENGEPYSPWEEKAGSVKLSDGRTLYIIAAKAFANHEGSTAECKSEVWHSISPAVVAAEFKKARAY